MIFKKVVKKTLKNNATKMLWIFSIVFMIMGINKGDISLLYFAPLIGNSLAVVIIVCIYKFQKKEEKL